MMSEYVTVVSVDLQPKCQPNGNIGVMTNEHEKKSSFVTVLSINNNQNTTTISTSENPTNGETVTVYRLPGERLGFGLKFQGGTKTNEKVDRLFIQSCDSDSPASRARASWGSLGEGDEILQIDHEPITNMTRIECVKCLKDRNVAINLHVKKGDSSFITAVRNEQFIGGSKRPLPPPPPKIPPRRINKKPTNPPPIAPPKAAKITETPVAAEMYLNCTLDDELNRNDESDETGSTISSQISIISNFSSESDLSSLLSATNASNSDLTRILTKPFQMIEREFNVNSTNIVTNTTPMSIDNLLLFNESEPNEFNGSHDSSTVEKVNDDIKTMSNYENITAASANALDDDDDDQRQYENIEIKLPLPPVPRPRSISLPQETSIIAGGHCETTPTNTTIESWLKDAKAVNEITDKSIIPSDEHHAQNYEPIKFESFVAADDEEEKLGPPELLNISEAYFNFPWCGNASNSLPTIGEAEEEFSSIEPAQQHFSLSQKIVNGPIFIVHESETDSACTDNVGLKQGKQQPICNKQNNTMEINNNDSSYLHKSEDKSDNIIVQANGKMHEKDIHISLVDTTSSGKVVGNSSKKVNLPRPPLPILPPPRDIKREMELKSDNDKSIKLTSNESVTQVNEKSSTSTTVKTASKTFNRNESAKSNIINNKIVIKHDSERLESQEIQRQTALERTLITIDLGSKIADMAQSNEMKTESKETTTTITTSTSSSLSVQNTITSDAKNMEQKQLSYDQKFLRNNDIAIVEKSRTSPDGIEYSKSRSTTQQQKTIHTDNGNTTSQSTIDINKFSSTSTTTTPKATAIVAPQRKTHHFEEITNFVDTKPPSFKSATLGRQRPTLNWRNKDEKSEKSVKDKIAMFSNSTSDISHILPKTPTTPTTPTMTTFRDKSYRNGMSSNIAKSTENIFSSGGGSDSLMKSKVNGSIKKKAMSVENLDDYDEAELRDKRDIVMMNYTPISKPMSLNSPVASAMSRPPLLMNMNRAQSVEYLNKSYGNSTPPPLPPSTAPISLTRRISFNGHTNGNNQQDSEESRKKSIANILENRKKSMSKLRGLVIPDRVPESDLQADEKVFDLPVIRSKECELINGNQIFSMKAHQPSTAAAMRKTFTLPYQQNLIKPAPRRSLEDDKKITPPIKPPRTSLIFPTQPKSLTSSIATDESDTESCMSSRVSTPPVSPVAKKPLIRTLSSNSSLSSNSTLTSGSGSQASCSSNGSGSPEVRKLSEGTITSRKSIVASSKARSGRNDKSDKSSSDGGNENEEKHRVPKAKARSSLQTNYKLISAGDNVVDKVINVATFVEVMSSDTEDKIETSESMSSVSTQKTIISPQKMNEKEAMSDMAKWVRKEASESAKRNESTAIGKTETNRIVPKSLDYPKKLNLSEIRKNFENKTSPAIPSPRTPSKEKTVNSSNHNRFSSWDSIASSSSGVSSELLGTGTGTNNSESLQTIQSDFGSFSSFGSSHSLITPQDLQSIIDEADPPLETSEAFVVVLHRETPESSIGITLAGGSDYEAKEITIHRILLNSPADRDGRLKRGDRLLSINGLSMRGLTHRESLSVLKSPRTDVVMVVTRSKSIIKANFMTKSKLGSLGSLSSLSERADTVDADINKSLHSSRSIDIDMDILNDDCSYRSQEHHVAKQEKNYNNSASDREVVNIIKDGTGIGISLDGGYDSPAGHKPLIIKKIFMGGAAEKLSNLRAGDEILEINGLSTERQTRIDVWNMIKKLPQGETVQLKIKRK